MQRTHVYLWRIHFDVWQNLYNIVKFKNKINFLKKLKKKKKRIAIRDKKDFLSDQCKEIEENNRMRKTRELFKKIRGVKGTFQAKIGIIKDKNGMDLTEAEDIKRGGSKNTQKTIQKRSS